MTATKGAAMVLKEMVKGGAMALVLALAGTAAQADDDRLARGILLSAGGKTVLAPCRDRSYVTVSDVSEGGAVSRQLTQAGLGGEKKLYAELVGKVDNGLLAVTALNFALPDGRCQAPGGRDETWRAAGDGWSLAVNDAKATWHGGDGRSVEKSLAGAVPPVDGGVREWQRSGPGYSLRFVREACRGRDGAAFGWRAAVEIDGRRYEGCAWQR